MPVVASADGTGTDLPAVIARQASGANQADRLRTAANGRHCGSRHRRGGAGAGGRLWVNSLRDGFVTDAGGERYALREPDSVWGRLYRSGITMIPTDEPEALLRYRATMLSME